MATDWSSDVCSSDLVPDIPWLTDPIEIDRSGPTISHAQPDSPMNCEDRGAAHSAVAAGDGAEVREAARACLLSEIDHLLLRSSLDHEEISVEVDDRSPRGEIGRAHV